MLGGEVEEGEKKRMRVEAAVTAECADQAFSHLGCMHAASSSQLLSFHPPLLIQAPQKASLLHQGSKVFLLLTSCRLE